MNSLDPIISALHLWTPALLGLSFEDLPALKGLNMTESKGPLSTFFRTVSLSEPVSSMTGVLGDLSLMWLASLKPSMAGI